jgi:hypothetical protein
VPAQITQTCSSIFSGANYQKGTGQLLSNTGAVIALDKGPVADEFFLTFEKIGTHAHTVSAEVFDPKPSADLEMVPRFGMRTFDQINATYSKLTGVPITNASVAQVFAAVQQQLPSVPSIDSFLGSHQTGIAQLAIAYCSAMVDDSNLRTAFFGAGLNPTGTGFGFYGGAAPQTNREAVISKLYTNLVGSNLPSMPTQTEIHNELEQLLVTIVGTSTTTTPTGTNANGAAVATKAACAAVLGSAVTTVQ